MFFAVGLGVKLREETLRRRADAGNICLTPNLMAINIPYQPLLIKTRLTLQRKKKKIFFFKTGLPVFLSKFGKAY